MVSYPVLKSLKEPLKISQLSGVNLAIKETQTLLKEGGFYLGDITGVADNKTIAAFKDFKKKAFLEYPDILGNSTVIALLEIVGEAKHPDVAESNTSKLIISQGKSIKLPGKETVYCSEPINGCQHFLWGEATKNGTRIPLNNQIVQNIIRLAEYLELIRALLENRVVTINSWYRPPEVNSLVGGVSNSQHLFGNAIDIVVQGIPPSEVYRRLNNWHGARGGLGNSNTFTHLDLRGYYARFSYGN